MGEALRTIITIPDCFVLAQQSFMGEALKTIITIPPPFNMIVLIVLIGTLAGLIGGIAKQIRRFACHRQELEFKRELVDRGMSAEEIERVVQARSTPTREQAQSCGDA